MFHHQLDCKIRAEHITNKMRFLILSALAACVCADADPQLLLGGAALPYATVGSAVVATPPASPASTVKTAPVVAAPVAAVAPVVSAALPAAVGYAGLGYAGLGYAGLSYAGLGYNGLGLYGRKKRDADAGLLLANDGANALPIATIPDLATAGYAPGASGALGGQAPVAAVAAAPVAVAPVVSAALPAAVGYAGLGYAGLGYAGLGYAGLGLYGRKKRDAEAGVVSALPVVTLPAAATAGYAVGASGAVGGQGAIAAVAAAPAALGY